MPYERPINEFDCGHGGRLPGDPNYTRCERCRGWAQLSPAVHGMLLGNTNYGGDGVLIDDGLSKLR